MDAGGIEDSELSKSRFSVELDDLGIVSNDGDWTAIRGASKLVAIKVDVFPFHGVDLWFAVVAVVEELPLRCDRHRRRRHGGGERKSATGNATVVGNLELVMSMPKSEVVDDGV